MANGWPPSGHHNVSFRWVCDAGQVPRSTTAPLAVRACSASGADDQGVQQWALAQVDLERLRKPLKVTDIDAFRASPAGAPADRLVHVTEHR